MPGRRLVAGAVLALLGIARLAAADAADVKLESGFNATVKPLLATYCVSCHGQDKPEGEGTVLDNSCLMFMSNMFSGSKHDNSKVPIITAGSLGGTLKTGRVLDYSGEGNENRKLCSLYLGLMDRMGLTLPHFGDADSRLANL